MNPAIQHLIDQLNASDPAQRITACDALGQFAAANADTHGLIEQGLPSLARVLQIDPIREVRWAAAYALGALGDPAAIPALEAAYAQTADDTGLRLVIVKALGKTAHPDAAQSLLQTLQTADSRCLRAAAAKALDQLGIDASQEHS